MTCPDETCLAVSRKLAISSKGSTAARLEEVLGLEVTPSQLTLMPEKCDPSRKRERRRGQGDEKALRGKT
jgi:hypothetical protein